MKVLDSVYNVFTNSFLPPEEKCVYNVEKKKVDIIQSSFCKKVSHYVVSFLKMEFCLIAIPILGTISIINDLKNKIINLISYKKDIKVVTEEEIAEKFNESVEKPAFSDSFFQTCLFGTKFSKTQFRYQGECDWAEWVRNPEGHIEGTPERIQSSAKNILDYPEAVVQTLLKMGAKAYRFSLERSVIEPMPGVFDEIAIEKHLNFCRILTENGIEPWITLNHFVMPKWFADRGGFGNQNNIDNFVVYCKKIIPIFSKHVKHFSTFNELGVDGFQRRIRGKYPSKKRGIFAYIEDVQNMMIAHYRIYDEVKKDHPEIHINLTHQWLKFIPINSYNPIERIICYALSHITHYAIFNCLKTGYFRIPFLVNRRLWDAKKPTLDSIGVQYYGFPRLKSGFGSGDEPGVVQKYRILSKLYFVAGATCEKNGSVSNFGPPFDPEHLKDTLEEAETLAPPVITETGADAMSCAWGEKKAKLDRKTQKEYFRKIVNIISKFKLRMVAIWTLYAEQVEWENGVDKVQLGLADVVKDYKTGEIKTCRYSPAAEYIQSVFRSRVQPAGVQVA